MRAPAVLALVVLLTGCIETYHHCGLHPEWVDWREPGFHDALMDAPAPGWSVRVVDAPPGLPHDEPTLDAWNATVQDVWREMRGESRLLLRADGRLGLHGVVEALPDGMHDDVAAALADVTDGNGSERRAWTDRLLDSPETVSQVVGDERGDHRRLAYATQIPLERVRLDGLLAGNVPDQRTNPVEAGDWRVELAFPHAEATRDTRTFTADVFGGNQFTDDAWTGEFPEEEALAQFRAAYQSLGIGAPPAEAHVSGMVC